MNTQNKTTEFIIEYYKAYPKLEIQDILKTLHQSVFGCGHFVNGNAYSYLLNELDCICETNNSYIEALDGDFSRIYLSYVSDNMLSKETLFKIFSLSSKKSCENTTALEKKLTTLTKLVESGQTPFSAEEIIRVIDNWKENDYCAMHHSDTYRTLYSPHYRVVHNDFIKLLPLLSAIDKLLAEKGQVNIAIDGGSASGKTTLSALLSEIYDCNVFHMDDFFLRPEQRSSKRLEEAGGNVDRERFLEEVLLPLYNGENIIYRPFDCGTQTILSSEIIKPKKLNIIEGAYSLHPELQKYYDYKVFLDVDKDLQKARIHKRNSECLQDRFFNEWIPMENLYFNEFNIKNICDLCLEIENEQ